MRLPGSLTVVLVTGLMTAAPADAFDTGPHSDITRDAMVAEGFGNTAADVGVINNWFVDLYSNAKSIPQSGHSTIGKGLLGSFLGPRENWQDNVVQAAGRGHFDSSHWDISNAAKAGAEWDRMQRGTSALLKRAKTPGRNGPLEVLTAIGIGLHELQDFYSHSNWIEQIGVTGTDGTDWTKLNFGQTPTWFDVPVGTRNGLNVYIGETTGHPRTHGKWNTDGNRSMVHGVAKDWPGRPGYTNAYTTAYFATRQWLRAMRQSLGDDALWGRAQRYAARDQSYLPAELRHDLRGALRIGMMSGHWQGQGEPCNPEWSLNICGARNGLGGDLIGLRNATRDYFGDRGKTTFRHFFESSVLTFAEDQPAGDLMPIASSQDLQRSTRFVRVQVRSMEGIDLGDIGPDRADMFSKAIIAGQQFQSGEINGRDSFSFPKPYSPFMFLKAVPAGGTYREPVTSMTVEIRTSSSLYSGTDDDVYLRVGPNLRFPLDKRLYNDFERGDRDTYSVPIDDAVRAGLSVGDIRQVSIEKSRDGVAGGWKLRGVKLVVNGRQVYARDGIDRWLEDDKRTWRAPDFRAASPAGAALPVTVDLIDEDSFIYGGNDTGDLNSYDRRKALALAYTPGTTVARRATGGSSLSGRLGDSDKARIDYVVDTLTPVAAPVVVPPPVVVGPPVVVQPPPPPPPPAAKPDLVISAMDFDPDPAKLYYFTVTNQGKAAAGPFTVEVTGEKSFVIPGLAPGASSTQSYRSTCKVSTRTAIADSLGQVAESDETNNTRSFTETICIV